MKTQSPTTAGAVFLSYASQDAEAARRIFETLRAAGVEVWFDKDELRGGDQWDAKIKRQIRECALFVPIISRTTQARSEGYFRREWSLATQRLLDMAPGRPFLLPVVIDDTAERDAIVQEEFLLVQWTRLPGGEVPSAAVERVRVLLDRLASGTVDPMPRRKPEDRIWAPPVRSWRGGRWIIGAVTVGIVASLGLLVPKLAASRTKHLAVLPFSAIGDARATQVFGEGLSETITSQLTRLEQFQRTLLVVPMGEIRREAVTTPSQARAIFGATLVLTGSVQRTEAYVRVTVNLIDATTLRIVRSETFDNPPTELFHLQDRIGGHAAAWLELELSPEAKRALASGQTSIGSAYELYVQGRGELARRDASSSLDAGIVYLQQALIADPSFALAHAALGEAFWRKYVETKERRWIDEAQRSCRTALQFGANLASPHVTLATLLAGTGEYEPAVAEAESALRLDPASVEATRALARAYDRLNRPAEAEAAYLRALERNPENPQAVTDLAAFYWRTGRTADAEKHYLRVAELTPQSYSVYRNLGGLSVMTGRVEAAAAYLEKSITLKPTASAISNLGTLRFQQRRYAEAAALFDRAAGLAPRDHVPLGNLADALRYVPGRSAEARDVYARAMLLANDALQVNPKSPDVRAQIARYAAFSGDAARAQAEIRQARSLAPANVPVIYTAAVVFERTGDRTRAIEELGHALKRGFSRIEVESNPDLEQLRLDPRYLSLLPAPIHHN